MSILFYSADNQGIGKHVLQVIQKGLPGGSIKAYQSIETLCDRFHQPRGDIRVMVLLAANREELGHLFDIRNLFWDIPIILILPDREKGTIERGHKFYPRLISHVDGDLSEVSAVLTNLVRKTAP